MNRSLRRPAPGRRLRRLTRRLFQNERGSQRRPAARGPRSGRGPNQDRDLARTLTLTAEFKPYQEVDVMAKVAGYIKEINVDIGDRVTEDQLLATLEIPEMADDLRHANASVERSQANVKQAQDELTRAKSAYE